MSQALAKKSRKQTRFQRRQNARTAASLAMEGRAKEQDSDAAWLSRRFRVPPTTRPLENYLTAAANISWPNYDIVEKEGKRFIRLAGRHLETVAPYDPPTEDKPNIDETLVAIPDEWTPDYVRSWLRAALETAEKMSSPMPKGGKSWPVPIIRNVTEAYGYGFASAYVPPSKEDIDRMDIVLPHWLSFLDGAYARKAVMAVAKGLSYRRTARLVADEDGRRYSHERARTVEQEAVKKICAALNNLG